MPKLTAIELEKFQTISSHTVIPIRDLDALCGSIKTLYSDPLLRCQMGINARERVSQDFGWDDYARRAEKIFSDLLR
jgi:glycosyltransferase involved in cell wall biosynthesis